MANIAKVRIGAPYVYLAKFFGNTLQGEYLLFIIVPTANHTRVVFSPIPAYTENTTIYNCTIIADTNATNTRASTLIPLYPTVAHGNVFDPDNFEIKIVVSNSVDGTTTKTTVMYADADAIDTLVVSSDWKASNCPYVYLTNPQAESGEDIKDFAPRCLVPMGGNIDMITQSGFEAPILNGICQQSITLSQVAANVNEIDPAQINSNGISYNQNGLINGFFEVEVTLPHNAALTETEKRKSRLRNKSSDTNPNSFID